MNTQLNYSDEGSYDVSDFFNTEDCRLIIDEEGKVTLESPSFDISFSDYEDFLMCFTNTGEGYSFKGNDDGVIITLEISYEAYERLEAIWD